MRYLLALILCLLVLSTLQAQSSWKMNLETEIYNPLLSPNGKYLVYYTNEDSVMAECIEVVSGKQIWVRSVKEFKNYRVTQFIGNDTVMIGEENRYQFLNVKDGSTIATLPIVGETWRDLKWYDVSDADFDTLKPWVRDSIGIYYFDDGMQILDLKKLSIIYQTTESPSKVKYYTWENYLMIRPVSGGDSVYFVDFKNNKLVYKRSSNDRDPNASIYQPFAISNSRLITFDEDDIQCVDLTTGTVKSVIPVDPDDPELYAPVIFKSGLYLIVSDEGVQTLYNTDDGTVIFKTQVGRVPGVVEQVLELPNNEAMLMAYDDNDRMTMYKVNMKTGDVIWSNLLFVQDGTFVSGHKQGSKVFATIVSFALKMLAQNAYNRSSAGRYGYDNYSGFDDRHSLSFGSSWSSRQDRDDQIRRANDMYNSWVNIKKESPGYATVLESDSTKVILAAAGHIYTAATADTARVFDGEGIFTIRVSDGAATASTRCAMLANSESGSVNAVSELNIQKLDSARLLIGSNDVYVVRSGGAIEHFGFGEEVIAFLNSSRLAANIRTNHDGDYYDYWRVDVSVTPARKYLIARSVFPNLVFHDTAGFSITLRVEEDSIEAFPQVVGDVTDASFTARRWVLTEDELDSLTIGNLGKKNVKWDSHLQGIWLNGSDVYLLGSNGVGFVSSDGTCRWAYEWSPNAQKTRMGLTRYGNSIVYSTGGETVVINPTCPMTVVAKSEISFSDAQLLVSKETNAIILDTDDGIIEGYPVK